MPVVYEMSGAPLLTAPFTRAQMDPSMETMYQQATGYEQQQPSSFPQQQQQPESGSGQPTGDAYPQTSTGAAGTESSGPATVLNECKVFVGGLPFTTTNMTLLAFFAQFGPVLDARVVSDRATGRSKGFGFVTFHDAASASAAVAAGFHNIEGRQCNVNIASDKVGEKRPFEGGDGGSAAKRPRYDAPPIVAAYGSAPAYAIPGMGAYGMPQATPGMGMHGMPVTPYVAPYVTPPLIGANGLMGRPDNKLFIASLPHALNDQRLAEILTIFGDVMEARIVKDRETGESKGYGFVTFIDPASAIRAATCQQLQIDGRRCPCNLASVNKKMQ